MSQFMVKPVCDRKIPESKSLFAEVTRGEKDAKGQNVFRFDNGDVLTIVKPQGSRKKLGTGTFAEVWLAELYFAENKETIPVAVKKTVEEASPEYVSYKKDHVRHSLVVRKLPERLSLEREFKLQSQCNHSNVVKAFHFGIYQSKHGATKKFIVLEFSGEELYEKISDQPLTAGACWRVLNQGLSALKHIHEKGIMHRDLKPENFFYTFDKDGNIQIKIGDFGLATEREKSSQYVGSLTLMAPEIGLKKYGKLEKYDKSVDIFSFGVTIYTCYYGFPKKLSDKIPWTSDLLYKQIPDVSSFDHVVYKMTQSDSKNRPTLEEIENHPWCKAEQQRAEK